MSTPPLSERISQEKMGHAHHELSRQMTVNLTPDQYERLFFQPSAAKGDLSKRFANPTLLGLLGFLIPYSITIFSLLNFQGSSAASFTGISGTFYAFGGIAMILAGLMEFILGNTLPMTIFLIYGSHFVNLGYIMDPLHGIVATYNTSTGTPGALSQAYNAGQGNYFAVMTFVTFCFLCGSIRVNIPFVLIFFTVLFVFAFFSAAYYQLGHNPTAAGLEHAVHYFKIAGGFGFVALVLGWYLAIITACATTGVPCPLPVFDLSQKVFPHSDAVAKEHAGARTTATDQIDA